jgi:hypothetical protein
VRTVRSARAVEGVRRPRRTECTFGADVLEGRGFRAAVVTNRAADTSRGVGSVTSRERLVSTTRASVRFRLTNSGVETFRSGEGERGGHGLHRAVETSLARKTVADVGGADDRVVSTARARKDGLSAESETRAIVTLGTVNRENRRLEAVVTRLADGAVRSALETSGETNSLIGARLASSRTSDTIVSNWADATTLDAGDVDIRSGIRSVITVLAEVTSSAITTDLTVVTVLASRADSALRLRSEDGKVLIVVSTVVAKLRSLGSSMADLRSCAVERSDGTLRAVCCNRALFASSRAVDIREVTSWARNRSSRTERTVVAKRADVIGIASDGSASRAVVTFRAEAVAAAVVGAWSFAVISGSARSASGEVLGESAAVVRTRRARNSRRASSGTVVTNWALTTNSGRKNRFGSVRSESAEVTSVAESSGIDTTFGEAVESGNTRSTLRRVDQTSDVVVGTNRARKRSSSALRAVVTSWASDRLSVVAMEAPGRNLLEIQVAEEPFRAKAASTAIDVEFTCVVTVGTVDWSSRAGGTNFVARADVVSRSGRVHSSGAVPTSGARTRRSSQVGGTAVETSRARSALSFVGETSVVAEGSRRAANGRQGTSRAVSTTRAEIASDTIGGSCSRGTRDTVVTLVAIGER